LACVSAKTKCAICGVGFFFQLVGNVVVYGLLRVSSN